jgi:hypothetical protein
MQEGNERSEQEHRFDGATEIYVTGPSWPSAATVNVNDAPANPWSKQHWNLTRQGQIYRQDQAKANRLAQAAGHKDALSACRENAK